jgi:hypothetical protein
MASRKSTVADRARAPRARTADPAAAQLATIVAVDDAGVPVLDVGAGPTVAGRLAIDATRERLEAAIRDRHPVVVLFEQGDRRRPIVVGFLETGTRTARPAPRAGEAPLPFVDIDADGRRLRITAQDEIVLQCGQASITLRRNGRVILRGTYVESHSDGTNRIKGGQVQIN